MDSFLLCLVLTFAIGLGGRDQLIVARLSDALGQSLQLWVLAAISAVAVAGVMVWLGITMAEILPARAADMLVAFALVAAALELAWRVKLKPMNEPTRSLGAVGIVLFARQLGDAARFVIFAFAAEATYPVTTMIGGGLGGVAAITVGWMMGGELERKVPLRPVRLVMAVCLFVAAVFIGLNARYGTH